LNFSSIKRFLIPSNARSLESLALSFSQFLVNRSGSNHVFANGSLLAHAHEASDTEGDESNHEENQEGNEQSLGLGSFFVNAVNNKNWVLSVNRLNGSVVTI
jgi:hypothetical protein